MDTSKRMPKEKIVRKKNSSSTTDRKCKMKYTKNKPRSAKFDWSRI